MENMEKVENIFLLKVENIFAGCGNGCMWWCRQGKVGVINLSTNFLTATSYQRTEKCYLWKNFPPDIVATEDKPQKQKALQTIPSCGTPPHAMLIRCMFTGIALRQMLKSILNSSFGKYCIKCRPVQSVDKPLVGDFLPIQ